MMELVQEYAAILWWFMTAPVPIWLLVIVAWALNDRITWTTSGLDQFTRTHIEDLAVTITRIMAVHKIKDHS